MFWSSQSPKVLRGLNLFVILKQKRWEQQPTLTCKTSCTPIGIPTATAHSLLPRSGKTAKTRSNSQKPPSQSPALPQPFVASAPPPSTSQPAPAQPPASQPRHPRWAQPACSPNPTPKTAFFQAPAPATAQPSPRFKKRFQKKNSVKTWSQLGQNSLKTFRSKRYWHPNPCNNFY